MIKFIILVIFINLIVVYNRIVIFYYNLCYLLRFLLIFFYIEKDIEWFNIMISLGCNYYSIMLLILSFWILGLIFICLSREGVELKLKLIIFVNILIVLVIFFTYIDFILFYLIFEIRLIPTFFLIIYWGGNIERLRAGYYIIIYILLISFPLLVYIFNMYIYGMTIKFRLIVKVINNYDITFWGFLIIYIAFFIKIPIYLFHVWLPKAHVEAPVYGSIVLAGVLLKIGRYGLIRLIEIFYKVRVKYRYIIFRIGIIGRIIIRILCLVQVDMKRIVAYSSVVHINLILCSLITFYKVGILGRYVIIISHGLCSSGIFFIVNLYYERSGRRLLFLNKGMIRNLPTIIIWWFLFCIMNFSFPLSLNFIGETLILIRIVNWDLMMIIYLILICFFRRAYSLYLFSYVYHGKNIYYESKIYNSSLKEYMILINHYFPLLIFILNLILFI